MYSTLLQYLTVPSILLLRDYIVNHSNIPYFRLYRFNNKIQVLQNDSGWGYQDTFPSSNQKRRTYLKADSQVYSDIQWEWCTYTEQNYWAPTCVHCIILTCYMGRSSITGTLHCWDKHTWSQLNIWTANLLMSRHWYQRWTVSHVWPLTGREYTEKWDRLTATSSKLSLIISSV